jgi:hypothetical protein
MFTSPFCGWASAGIAVATTINTATATKAIIRLT